MGRRPSSSVWGKAISLIGVAAGVALIAASVAWMTFAKPANVWSPEQAQEFNAAQSALHAAISGIDRRPTGDAGGAEDVIAQAQARFDRIGEQLEDARSARYSWGWRGVIAGSLLAAICGVGFRFLEKRDD
jgi:hypothetical protein